MELFKCALPECPKYFEKSVHNQNYHSKECTRIATNRRILEQYHANRAKSKLRNRVCSDNDCNVILSRYNDGSLCALHEEQAHVAELRSLGWQILDD